MGAVYSSKKVGTCDPGHYDTGFCVYKNLKY